MLRLVACPRLVEGDEAQHGEEGHLETRLNRRLRIDQQQHDGSKRKVSHRHCRALDDDGEEDDRHHDEGARCRRPAIREQHVEQSHQQRRSGGPLADRIAQGNSWKQRKAGAQHPEHAARRKPHVQPGNRQDVIKAGDEQAVGDGHRNGTALASDQRLGEGGIGFGQCRPDSRAHGGTYIVQPDVRQCSACGAA